MAKESSVHVKPLGTYWVINLVAVRPEAERELALESSFTCSLAGYALSRCMHVRCHAFCLIGS